MEFLRRINENSLKLANKSALDVTLDMINQPANSNYTPSKRKSKRR